MITFERQGENCKSKKSQETITRGSLSLRAKKDSVLWFTVSPGMGMEAVSLG